MDSSNVVMVLNCIGSVFLMLSWLVPYMMEKSKRWKDGEDHIIGAVLSAVAVGVFLGSTLVSIVL